jgi:hypothetical protein
MLEPARDIGQLPSAVSSVDQCHASIMIDGSGLLRTRELSGRSFITE